MLPLCCFLQGFCYTTITNNLSRGRTVNWALFDWLDMHLSRCKTTLTPKLTTLSNSYLDVAEPSPVSVWRETAGKSKIIFGFHPIKLAVGPSTPRAGIIIPHNPPGGVWGNFFWMWTTSKRCSDIHHIMW